MVMMMFDDDDLNSDSVESGDSNADGADCSSLHSACLSSSLS